MTEWGMAFSRYASVLAKIHPHMAVAVIEYQEFILLAHDFQSPNLAIVYDKEFCSKSAQDFSKPHN